MVNPGWYCEECSKSTSGRCGMHGHQVIWPVGGIAAGGAIPTGTFSSFTLGGNAWNVERAGNGWIVRQGTSEQVFQDAPHDDDGRDRAEAESLLAALRDAFDRYLGSARVDLVLKPIE